MVIRIWGAVLIILGCAAVGFQRVAAYTRQERDLRQFISSLQFMIAELEYRLTPLPELCYRSSLHTTGEVSSLFSYLAQELTSQINPNVNCCVQAALASVNGLSDSVKDAMIDMGKTLGEFDIDGQIHSLNHLLEECRQKIRELRISKEDKLRNYKTISICTGAFIAILFL